MPLPTLANVSRPRGQGFNARIDDIWLRMAAAPGRELVIETAPPEADRIQTGVHPEEFRSDFGDVFARSDFTGGEGLDIAHQREPPPRHASRFWDSRNIDVSLPRAGQPREATLLTETELAMSTASTNLYLAVQRESGVAYIAIGSNIRRIVSPEAPGTPSFTTENPDPSSSVMASGLAILGREVFVALGGTGIKRRSAAGTWSHWSDQSTRGLWSVKDRIMAAGPSATPTNLYEITESGPGPDPLISLQTGERWTSVVDAGAAVLAAASNGYIYAFAPGEDAILGLVAQSFLGDQTPVALASIHGIVFWATARTTADGEEGRLWRGVLTPDLTIGSVQLLREWPAGGSDRAPKVLLANHDELIAPVRNGGEIHLWRHDLATGGLARGRIIPTSGSARGMAMAGDRILVTVDGSGLWRDALTYAGDGWLIGPLGDFFSSSDKSWISGRIELGPMPAGSSVELLYATELRALQDHQHPNWTSLGTITEGGVTTVPISGLQSRWIAGQVRLNGPPTQDDSPSLRSFSFRAYPTTDEVMVRMPVNVADVIEAPGRKPTRVRGRGAKVLDALREREGRAVEMELLRPALKVSGLLESVSAPVLAITRRGSVTAVSMVTVRGQKVED